MIAKNDADQKTVRRKAVLLLPDPSAFDAVRVADVDRVDGRAATATSTRTMTRRRRTAAAAKVLQLQSLSFLM
jgi:hypothetical protein